MNLLEHYVIKVLSNPYKTTYGDSNCWEVDVEYDCYGCKGKSKLCFQTKEEAEQVKVGYVFMA